MPTGSSMFVLCTDHGGMKALLLNRDTNSSRSELLRRLRGMQQGSVVNPTSPGQAPSDDRSDTVTLACSTLSQLYDSEGDTIVRTQDSVDFLVYKAILGLASPVFKIMFALPRPAHSRDDKDSTPPVIPISESSTVFELLLGFCYPTDSPQLEDCDISLIGDVLAASLKYKISPAIKSAKRVLRVRSERTKEDAMAAYAIACHLKQKDDARAAAVSCLKWPFPGPKVPQLSLMSALDLYTLMEYHEAARNAVVDQIENNRYLLLAKACEAITPAEHACPGRKTYTYTINGERIEWHKYRWWASSLSTLSNAFRLAPLDTDKLSLATVAPSLLDSDCHICRETALYGWEESREKIITFIRSEIDKIELELSWK